MRHKLLRGRRKATYYLLGCVLFFFALIIIPDFSEYPKLVVVPAVLLLVSIFVPLGSYFVRCSSCKYPMDSLWLKWGAKDRRANFCPHCGTSLDQPL